MKCNACAELAEVVIAQKCLKVFIVIGQKLVITFQQHTKFEAEVNNKNRNFLYEKETVLHRMWSVFCGKSFSEYY